MNFKWNVESRANCHFLQLQGSLTRNTLLPLWQQRTSLFVGKHCSQCTLYIELNQLSAVDSAGFVLICDILHYYSQQSTVKLVGVPHLILDFAELYDLDQWITPFIQ